MNEKSTNLLRADQQVVGPSLFTCATVSQSDDNLSDENPECHRSNFAASQVSSREFWKLCYPLDMITIIFVRIQTSASSYSTDRGLSGRPRFF